MFVLQSMPSILHEYRQSPTFGRSVEEFRQKRRSAEIETKIMRSPAASRGSRIRAQLFRLTPPPLPECERVRQWCSGIEGKAPHRCEAAAGGGAAPHNRSCSPSTFVRCKQSTPVYPMFRGSRGKRPRWMPPCFIPQVVIKHRLLRNAFIPLPGPQRHRQRRPTPFRWEESRFHSVWLGFFNSGY